LPDAGAQFPRLLRARQVGKIARIHVHRDVPSVTGIEHDAVELNQLSRVCG